MLKLLSLLILLSHFACADNKPEIQLAQNFNNQPLNIKQYWISEKLDGIRGYWTGSKLLTRNGNIIHAPDYFIKNWPKQALDGELWLARNRFEDTLSCVSQHSTQNSCWLNIRFMVFDLPQNKGNFTERLKTMTQLIKGTHNTYLTLIPQQQLKTLPEMDSLLASVTTQGGEGLMLHHGQALYKNGRQSLLLKVKKRHDAEAKVIAHLPGKGKFKGMLGAIKVETAEGIIFKIGTGFSNVERRKPPAIGTIISFQYLGKTQKGVPRFASYLRPRKSLNVNR